MRKTLLSTLVAVGLIGSAGAQLSTNAITFPAYSSGIYTTTIKETNNASPQTNAVVKVAKGQVFKVLSCPFGTYIRAAAYNQPDYNYDQISVSLDGVNYTSFNVSQYPVISGPAWIQYIHQAVNNSTPTVFITFSLYNSTPTPVIHY